MRCSSPEAAASVVPASITHSVEPLWTSRDRKPSPINVSISNCRRLSLGKRSVPPATNIAAGPRSAAMRAASRAVLGRRYLNRGRRSTRQLPRWWFDLDRRRIGDGGELGGTEAGRFTLCFSAQRLDDFLGRDGYFIDPHAE